MVIGDPFKEDVGESSGSICQTALKIIAVESNQVEMLDGRQAGDLTSDVAELFDKLRLREEDVGRDMKTSSSLRYRSMLTYEIWTYGRTGDTLTRLKT